MELTQERLKELLDYDKDIGIFTWKQTRNGHVKKGNIAGWKTDHDYIKISILYKTIFAHRLAWFYFYGKFPQYQLDHINGIRTDNRICNLRECNNAENQQNQKKPQKINSTGFLGVYPVYKSKNFRAKITINKKTKHLGNFKTAIEAHDAYIKAKRELHEFNTL